MSTCARCGSSECYTVSPPAAPLSPSGMATDIVACRDRELANLRSLLRSVTGKLEEASELLDGPTEARTMFAAAALIDSVLEVLS